MSFQPAVPYDATFDAVYGLEVLEEDPERGIARGRIAVRPDLCDHDGALAGGVMAAAAEALTSRATALGVVPRGLAASGLSNDTTMFGRVTEGHVDVEARLAGRTDTEWVWSIDARDAAGRPCALARVTVAVRPLR
jgi:acyl-coenzyme A thioesterase PaaI-like protein